MPTISLFTPPKNADASHRVTSPGGYEWWQIDAEDSKNQLRMTATFHQGYVFHPGYLREYYRYLRRPTRNTPPLPSQFSCVGFQLHQGDQTLTQFILQNPTGLLSATDKLDVSIGSSRVHSNDDGSIELSINAGGASAHFQFVPRMKNEPLDRRFLSRSWSKADHHWVLANPFGEASGTIDLTVAATGKARRFSMNGPGCHDHAYGTGPIGPGLKRWMSGRVLMDDHAVMFQYAQPLGSNQPDDIHMFEADSFGLRELPVDCFNADWSSRTSAFLHYPAWVEAGALQLVNPRVIDASPFDLKLIYDASVRGTGGKAFCRIAYPNRLRWPVLDHLMEKSMAETITSP